VTTISLPAGGRKMAQSSPIPIRTERLLTEARERIAAMSAFSPIDDRDFCLADTLSAYPRRS